MDSDTYSKIKKSLRIKIISLGNAEVGKSCIIKRYCEKRFVPKYLPTIGIDYGVTRVTTKGHEVKVNIFDMAGHPVFYDIRNEFYNDTQGVLLVYDVAVRSSFDALDLWMEEIKRELNSSSELENIIFIVCANKKDKKRVVDEAEGQLWADVHGFQYYEVSAQSGDGISDMFQAFFDGIVAAIDNGGRKLPKSTQLGYTKEQVEAIQRLKNAKDDFQRLGLTSNATTDDVNKAFRKLSILLHPDKSIAPGSEDAFKILVAARTNLLRLVSR